MPPFNGRQIQQQLRAFLVFIQLQIIMYFHFLRQAQQQQPPPPPPAPPAPIQRPRRRHNMWVRPWLLQREERGAYHNIMADLYATDIPGFTNYMRMTPEFFEMMKTRLEPRLARQSSYQCWGEVSPHHQISGHWRVIHIIILSVQGWQIHHFQVSTRGLQGHPGWVHQRVPQMSYYSRWVERTGKGIQDQVECSTCPGSPGWKACGPEETQELWSPLPQLQGVLFHCHVGLGRWAVQIQMGGCGYRRVLLRCPDI